MIDPKELDQKIRECVTSQQIADLQAQRSGYVAQVEGTVSTDARPLALPITRAGRVVVKCSDGLVDLPIEQLGAALKIEPDLTIMSLGPNASLVERIAQCRDASELTQLMTEARKGNL